MSKTHFIPAMLLVAGTCIGGGMLATPISTGISGFVPSIVVMFLCYFAMTITGVLLLEVSLWFGPGTHISTMTEKTLGAPGKALSWLLFLFISYASLVAYTSAGGQQISSALADYFQSDLSRTMSCLLFFVAFGLFVDFGADVVGRVNSILFFGMIGAYLLIVVIGAGEVNPEHFSYHRWPSAFLGIPLLLTSFSFQTMVPSLTPYLQRNASALRWSVIGGTTITFTVYLVWQWVVLGIVPPTGPDSLMTALNEGTVITEFIKRSTSHAGILTLSQFFSFFAIVTSFLGMSLGLIDFLSDGLKVSKKGWGKLLLGTLIAAPTLYFAIYFEKAFLVAMDITGGFGDSILNGLMPVCMVWVGRYILGYPPIMGFFGRKVVLVPVFLFFLFSLGIEVLGHLGYISSIYDVKMFD